jgi:hypothetical protein
MMGSLSDAEGRRLRSFLTAVMFAIGCSGAAAYQLSPSGTNVERHEVKAKAVWYERYKSGVATWGVYNFTHPVHEEITQLIFGCDTSPDACADPEIEFAPPTVVAGVRWNDDPPFRLATTAIQECKTDQTIRVVTQPVCWYNLFRHAEKRARITYFDGKSKRWNTMYRSHFGDLQFLHSMASRDGERAGVTRDRVMMWAEFAWSVAIGTEKGNTLLKDVKVNGFADFFPHSGQDVLDLYTLGNRALRRGLGDVAFGSLLHVVQDSFAFGHAERAKPFPGAMCPETSLPQPGVIRTFRSYSNQDHKKHGAHDAREAFRNAVQTSPNAIDVGKVLLAMYDEKKPWSSVEPYLRCVFAVQDENIEASPGDGLEM